MVYSGNPITEYDWGYPYFLVLPLFQGNPPCDKETQLGKIA